MRVLHLTLKKKWFDMIASGEKKEEYREIKPYWITRLVDCNCPKESPDDNKHFADNMDYDLHVNRFSWDRLMIAYYAEYKSFDAVTFYDGYSKGRRVMSFEVTRLEVSVGNLQWGADLGNQYFVISIGRRLRIHPEKHHAKLDPVVYA